MSYLTCPAAGCSRVERVADGDRDTAFSELWTHVQSDHTNNSPEKTAILMTRAEESEE
ncbi:hypothetical protein [Streptomyces tsukubensis]|uniref:hypothetical protein n=1 Tax=Streptomyces tsukubensis TaxID=83656 RepID=UPI0015C40936|nr:hypothetical protein [Streptomyces tsukubensis]